MGGCALNRARSPLGWGRAVRQRPPFPVARPCEAAALLLYNKFIRLFFKLTYYQTPVKLDVAREQTLS